VGAVSLWFFTRRVFRPASRWAGVLFAAAAAVIAWGFVSDMLLSGAADFNERRWSSPPSVLGFASRTGAFAWAAAESLLYWRGMRRRLALGLADPLTTHRFLLWGAGNLAALCIYAVAVANIIVGAADGLSGGVFASTWALLTSAFGVVSGLCMWFAFFTPGFYRRRIRGAPRTTPRVS
jgi:hypothetical protein